MAGIHLIAAVGLSGQIGLQGQVPWHGRPEFAEHTARDLAEFKRLTAGGILIMGSVTAEGLPPSFNPRDRQIVVWRQHYDPADVLRHYQKQGRDIWICGGQKVYEVFVPHVDWHHISVIPYDGPADRFMPPILPTWEARGLLEHTTIDGKRTFIPDDRRAYEEDSE